MTPFLVDVEMRANLWMHATSSTADLYTVSFDKP